jgi:FtsH-binding integral membrane protein
MAVVTDTGGRIIGLTPFGQTLFGSPLKWLIILAPLGFVLLFSFRIGQLQASTARPCSSRLRGGVGLSLATIFMVYTATSITRVFFISAASFGALSLYGYTTQRSLDAIGSFLVMGLFGIIIASLVNIFLASSALQWTISVIGVVVFAGLTAWDTQKIKEMYSQLDEETVAGRKAVMGALTLYLDFINLFMMLLRLIGNRR